jgi:hypothetical protein
MLSMLTVLTSTLTTGEDLTALLHSVHRDHYECDEERQEKRIDHGR